MYINILFSVIYQTLVYGIAEEGMEWLYIAILVLTNLPSCYREIKKVADEDTFFIALASAVLLELLPHTLFVWLFVSLKPSYIWWRVELVLIAIFVISFLISTLPPGRKRKKQRRKIRDVEFAGFLGFPVPKPVG